jgi:hypothetical protein
MEAKVMLCDWCRGQSPDAFATRWVDIRQGPGGPPLHLDFCAQHHTRFTNLLREIIGRRPLTHDGGRGVGIPPTVTGTKRSLVAAYAIEAAILTALATADGATKGRPMRDALTLGTFDQRKDALRRVVQRGLVERSGNTGASWYRLTEAGTRVVQEKDVAAALPRFLPQRRDLPPALRRAVLGMLTREWVASRLLWKKLHALRGYTPFMKNETLRVLRAEGAIEMEGSKGDARYRRRPRAH